METPDRPELDDEDELDPTSPAQSGKPAAPSAEPVGEERDEGELPPGAGSVEGRGLTDVLRKAMVAGLGAVFMTEEGIRAYVKDLKLPKDVMNFVVGQTERSKAELFRVIGEELHRFFESELLRREVLKLLSQMTLEVRAEVRLKPAGEGASEEARAPEVRVQSATVRRTATKKKAKTKAKKG